MNTLLKNIVCILSISLCLSVNAKDIQPRIPFEQKLNNTIQALDLKDNQKHAVKKILTSKHEKMKVLKNHAKKLRAKGQSKVEIKNRLKPKRKALKKRTREQLKAVLTKSQFRKLKKIRRQHRRQNKKNRRSSKK
jgi:hypothetical protein